TVPAAEKLTLFQLGSQQFSVAAFLAYARANQKPNGSAPDKYLEQLLNSYTEAQLMEQLEAQVIATSPEYKWLLKEYYEGILLFDIMEKEVWNKASADSIGQRAYFDQHASSYKAGERVDATLYSATTKDHILNLKSALEKRDTAAGNDLVTEFRIRRDQGLFEKDDRIVLGKISWQPGIHLAENNNLHYLVHVKSIVPPGLKTFNEARPEVISDYQNFLEKKWVAQLKKKYAIKFNKKGKEQAFAQLLQAKTP
ncbi:MAG TPA: hypothetical protein VEB86_13065, partial [Chryseosolibacter sp.]|nr:hypothetical protein [Chryseosolibacter sp.]